MFLFNSNKITTHSDESLMRLVAMGNSAAFEELYERYFNKLCWYATGFLKDEAAAEDTVQEVFIKLMKTANTFNDDYKFSTWIYTVTANMCKNILRNEVNRQRILNEKPDITFSDEQHIFINLDSRLIKAELAEWLKELTDKEQQIYHLRFEQDLSLKEIAEIMDIPLGSVKSGIFYLLKKISNPLKKLMYEK